jgi:hypothetical protein
VAALLPEDDCQQIDTSALPVKHTSRVRGPDSWTGPGGLHARFGRDAAHAEWFYGFRLAIRTDLGSRIVRAWSIVPAAVNERDVADELLETGPPPRDLLVDKGFTGRAFTAGQAARGTAVLLPPAKGKRHRMAPVLRKIIAEWRNRTPTARSEALSRATPAQSNWWRSARTARPWPTTTMMERCSCGTWPTPWTSCNNYAPRQVDPSHRAKWAQYVPPGPAYQRVCP